MRWRWRETLYLWVISYLALGLVEGLPEANRRSATALVITALIFVPLWLFRRYWWYRKPTPHVDRTDGFTGGPDHHVIHVISGEAVVSVDDQRPQSVRRGDRLFIQKWVRTP